METITNQRFVRDPIEAIEGAALISRPIFEDDRGYFAEISKAEGKVFPTFVQQNTSFNYANVLRGMHSQRDRPQGKLVTCLYGVVLDVIFDLRPNSKTYLKGFAIELDFQKLSSIYCPPGVAHGFLTLSRFAVVHYACTTTYDPTSDGGFIWSDPAISDLWPDLINPIVSDKDANLPSLAEYKEQYLNARENNAHKS